MAGEWPTVRLGEVSVNHDAKRIPVKESERRIGPYPYYGASGVVDHVDSYLFDGEYLLVAEDGENLRTRQTPIAFMAKGKFWVNNHAHIIEGNHQARTCYIGYALTATDIAPFLTGAVMPKLTQGNLGLIPLPMPSIVEQDRIVDLLGSLDDKIELNQRMAATLEEIARALFKSWFVDFDPVRAKAEGRSTGFSDDLSTLFPDNFGESGEPAGWLDAPIVDAFDLSGGGTPKTSTSGYWNGEIPWFSVADAPQEFAPFVIATERTITPLGLESCASPLLPEGATIITARGTVGKLAVVGTPMAMNQSCYAAQPKREYTNYFVYFLLEDTIEDLKVKSHGSVFNTITRQTFDSVRAHLPPPNVAMCYDRIVEPLMSKIKLLAYQSQTLADLRDTLLPKLISGELCIADAEKRIAAA